MVHRCIFLLAVVAFAGASSSSRAWQLKVKRSSPIVTSLSWGQVVFEDSFGTAHTVRDAKLYPGGGGEWDWTITGTHHSPGIQAADCSGFEGADTVILSQGMSSQLGVPHSTVSYLEGMGKTVITQKSEDAKDTYNTLAAQGQKVAILLHSTC